MTRKRGNNEGSIYEHVRDVRKVGYRGAYTVHTAADQSAATYPVRRERKCGRSSRRL
jgi:hypothetical protein